MKAVVYCRVSTEEQTKNLSLETQQKQCLDYCQRHALDVAAVFIEPGESAKTINRPEFQKMLAYCRQHRGKIQYVVVYNLSRFSRQTHDHLAVRGLLAGLGISLRSVNEQIDESSTGKFLESVLAAVNQLDNDMRAERTKAGMHAALAKGRWTHRAPIGYLNEGKTLVPDPERAPFVRQAFELILTRQYTQAEVRRLLNAKGFCTVKAGQPVAPQTFAEMLRNPIYAGQLNGLNGTVAATAAFEALIPLDTFHQVQVILRGKAPALTPHNRAHPDFPLRTIVRCLHCQRPLTGSYSTGWQKKRHGYYHCPKGHVRVRLEDMERKLSDLLESLTPEPAYVQLLHEVVMDIWKAKQTEASGESDQIARHLVELRKRKDKLDDAIIERLISRETYQAKLDLLNEQIALAEISAHEAKLEFLDIDGTLKLSAHLMLQAARLWRELPSDRAAALVRMIFPQGLELGKDGFGTVTTTHLFKLLQTKSVPKSEMATPVVTGWNEIVQWLRSLAKWAQTVDLGAWSA